MKAYLDLLQRVLDEGCPSNDRTNTGTISVFGQHLKIPIYPEFPLLTTKKIYWRSVLYELFWFLSGSKNIQYLKDNKVGIWDSWANDNGDVGPLYGYLWRNWPGEAGPVDQLQCVIENIRKDPFSRRHVVTAWNPALLSDQALPPCHIMFQFYVRKGRLSCHLNQRSGDVFLGVPFNIASYSLLTYLVARVTGLVPHELSYTIVDCHLYSNHVKQAIEQLSRRPKSLPSVSIVTDATEIDEISPTEIFLNEYDPHPTIKAPVAV